MNDLSKKLHLKAGQTLLLVNAPETYLQLLTPMPENTKVLKQAPADHVHLFVKNREDLAAALPELVKQLSSSTIWWIIYPKKSSGIISDLDMMSSWTEPEKYGYRPVASISVDHTWTGLRFKTIDAVKPSGLGKKEIKDNELGAYLNVENKRVTLPSDLLDVLNPFPEAIEFFNTLSWTNKKEYVTWILTAKQEKTRETRVQKTVKLLNSRKKNPTDK